MVPNCHNLGSLQVPRTVQLQIQKFYMFSTRCCWSLAIVIATKWIIKRYFKMFPWKYISYQHTTDAEKWANYKRVRNFQKQHTFWNSSQFKKKKIFTTPKSPSYDPSQLPHSLSSSKIITIWISNSIDSFCDPPSNFFMAVWHVGS